MIGYPSLHTVLLCGVAVLLTACSQAESDVVSTEQIMVVLDASTAMAETMGQRPKLDLMRDEFGTLVKHWQEQPVESGLVIFGHRNENDCADIEVIDRPRPVDAVTLGRLSYGVFPTGRAPLTEAIYVAANQLDLSKGPSKIVAITNGRDTCGHDPCAELGGLINRGITLEVFNLGNGSTTVQCGTYEPSVLQAKREDAYSKPESGLTIQALRHDTGEPMWPMKWVLYGPDDAVYKLKNDDPTLDLSRMQATELRRGAYTITGFSGDFAGSSNFTLGANSTGQDVIYVTLFSDAPHTEVD